MTKHTTLPRLRFGLRVELSSDMVNHLGDWEAINYARSQADKMAKDLARQHPDILFDDPQFIIRYHPVQDDEKCEEDMTLWHYCFDVEGYQKEQV